MSASTRAKVISALAGAAAVASLFSLSPVAQAASLTEEQITSITNLLQSFNADLAAIAKVQSVLTGKISREDNENHATTTEATKPKPPRACPAIARTLKKGASGDDVSKIQEFLGGEVTGYYGVKTAEKIRQWQIVQGLISSSTPAASGAGLVGPRTRMMLEREIQKFCGIGQFRNATSTTAT